MDISISEKLWARIKQKVDCGYYPSVEIVLENAMFHLDEADEAASIDSPEIRAKVQAGIDDLRNGRYTVYTKETLHELFEDIKRRGRERRKSRNQWLVG